MVALELFDKITKLNEANYVGVEDFSDRLNFQATVMLLLAFCTTITFKTYILSPVSCYLPSEVGAHSGQDQYVNNFCWTEGTYAVPMRNFNIDNRLEDPTEPYKHYKIMYYQWVPFVLGLQALMFYLPRVLWSLLSYNRAGTDVGHMIRSANDAVQDNGEKHEKLVDHVTKRLEQMLQQRKPISQTRGSNEQPQQRTTARQMIQRLLRLRHRIHIRFGNWLILTYFAVKLLYLGNAVGQMFLMHRFLGFNWTNFAFGVTLLQNLNDGKDWRHTMIFPRVGCCAINFRGAANSNHMFAQCTLPINMINEKIYIFLWFWIGMTVVLTAFSMPLWAYRILYINRRGKFVKNFLKLSDNYKQSDEEYRECFLGEYLRQDGTFLLKMISINSGDVVCTEIVAKLWQTYLSKHKVEESDHGEAVEESKEEVKDGEDDEGGERGIEKWAEAFKGEEASPAEDKTLLKRFNSQMDEAPVNEKRRLLKQQLSEPS